MISAACMCGFLYLKEERCNCTIYL